MAIDPFLLALLVCPETRDPVAPASAELLGRLRAAVEKGTLTNRGGQKIAHLDGALVRQDQRVAYPVRDDIPVMLVDEQLFIDDVR